MISFTLIDRCKYPWDTEEVVDGSGKVAVSRPLKVALASVKVSLNHLVGKSSAIPGHKKEDAWPPEARLRAKKKRRRQACKCLKTLKKFNVIYVNYVKSIK